MVYFNYPVHENNNKPRPELTTTHHLGFAGRSYMYIVKLQVYNQTI